LELASRGRRAERRAIAKAITLVESTRPEDLAPADELLAKLYPAAGRALRLGVSGVPGAGKSTLIDALGLEAIRHGRRVGVLSIDPSSQLSGGSVLGDRTRMGRLAQAEEAFVRPSPSSGASGGLGRRTREALVVLEAAGFDLVVVETVGSGQAEIAVTELVDVLVVVLRAGAGDDVQGIKRGLLEHADLVVFNKADGPNAVQAALESSRLESLFSWMRHGSASVLAVSALEGRGVSELWTALTARFAALEADGTISRRRRAQRVAWLKSALAEAVLARFELSASQATSREITLAVERGDLVPRLAARQLVGLE
jgi:LAO/AO transport system kinase